MDNNKMIDVLEFSPRVHIANFFDLRGRVGRWGPRTLTDYELILIREGRYYYVEEDVYRWELVPGDLLVIPPMRRHVLFLSDDDKGNPGIACIHNYPVYPDLRLPEIPRKTALSPEDFTLVTELFEKTANLFEGDRPYRQELLSTFCRQIWLIAGAYWNGVGPGREGESRMEKMLLYISKNGHRKLTRKDLAREFGLTPEYVNALFKRELALSPTQFINREKMRRGYILLHNEGLSVKEAAYRCGFRDEYYFARLFKKILGVSPGVVKGGGLTSLRKRLK